MPPRKTKKKIQTPAKNQPSIIQSFKISSDGLKCPVCGKRINHAVYQRHLEKCDIHPDDDDVIFISQTCTTLATPSRKVIQKREFITPITDYDPNRCNNGSQEQEQNQANDFTQNENEQAKDRFELNHENPLDGGDRCPFAVVENSNLINEQENSPSQPNSSCNDAPNANICSLKGQPISDSQFEHHNNNNNIVETSYSKNIHVNTALDFGSNQSNNVENDDMCSERHDILISETLSRCDDSGSNGEYSNMTILATAFAETDFNSTDGVSSTKKRPSGSQFDEYTSSKKSKTPDIENSTDVVEGNEESCQIDLDPIQSYTSILCDIKKWMSLYRYRGPTQTLQTLKTSLPLYTPHSQQPSQHFDEEVLNKPTSSKAVENDNKLSSQTDAQHGLKIHYSLELFWEIIFEVISTHQPEKIIALWSVHAQQLIVRLYLKRWNWYCAGELEYLGKSSQLDAYLEELSKSGILINGFSTKNMSLLEVLNKLNVRQMTELCRELKLQSGRKEEMFLQLQKFSQLKNYFGSTTNEQILLDKIQKQLKVEFYRISEKFLNFIDSIFTIYSPFWMDPQHLYDDPSINIRSQLIYKLLQAKKGELNFVSASIKYKESLLDLFPTYKQLLLYIQAKRVEEKLVQLFNGKKFEDVFSFYQKIKKMLIEQLNELLPNYTTFSLHQRQFTSPWILIRCLGVCSESFERLRNYEKAVEILDFLVSDENVWHFSNSRWHWHIRLALNLDTHLKDYRRAFDACTAAFCDETIGPAHKLSLQERAGKLAKKLKQPFTNSIPVLEIEEEKISGKIIAKNLGDGIKNHFYLQSSNNEINCCSVEDIALHHFLTNGYTEGYHSEGNIWHTIFRLFFYDIIYANDIPYVWNSKLQDDPSDLNFRTFYTNRKERFDSRLKEVQNLDTSELKDWISTNYNIARSYGWTCSRIGWQNFNHGLPELQRFVSCCPPALLHALFLRLIRDFKNTRSGFPDLTLWNVETKKLLVAEVKGPNDKLSSKQILWLNFFSSNGVRAICVKVKAKNGRHLT